MFKSAFPLLRDHPKLIYLDNAATTQKPEVVIDGVSAFLKNEYANIHRGLYSLSEASENHYYESKELVAELLNISAKEVIYTSNATSAVNLLAQSLVNSNILKPGDVVLVGVWDHHANSLPRMSLAKRFGFEVRFFGLDENFHMDKEDFKRQYTDEVKVVACSQVSNVTGGIYDMKWISSVLREETFFVVDASQSVPNMHVDMQEINCDALVFTGHKVMAYTGIGVLALKHQRIKKLTPLAVGGGTIKDASSKGFDLLTTNEKFEAGTPDIIGAVSLKYALKFIKSLSPDQTLRAGIQVIAEQEKKLTTYALERFQSLKDQIQLVGPTDDERVALFSFVVNAQENFNQVGEFFAEKNICIRCGGHCAYPLHKHFHLGGTCRMSAYLYNSLSELECFFNELDHLLAS